MKCGPTLRYNHNCSVVASYILAIMPSHISALHIPLRGTCILLTYRIRTFEFIIIYISSYPFYILLFYYFVVASHLPYFHPPFLHKLQPRHFSRPCSHNPLGRLPILKHWAHLFFWILCSSHKDFPPHSLHLCFCLPWVHMATPPFMVLTQFSHIHSTLRLLVPLQYLWPSAPV